MAINVYSMIFFYTFVAENTTKRLLLIKKPSMTNQLCCARLRIVMILLLACSFGVGNAQFVRTSYFMDGAQYRLQLNPALAPTRGYIHLPGVSRADASLRSNALGAEDIYNLFKNADDADFFTTDKFFNKLKEYNKANASTGTDLFAVGKWHGNGFISVNIGLRVDGNMTVSRELFSFMRDMKGINSNDYADYARHLQGEELNFNAYSEVGVGYTRLIGDRLSVGGRVKGLLGLGNVKFKINNASVKTNLQGVGPDFNWSAAEPDELLDATGTAQIDVDADLVASFHGLELKTNTDGYIDKIKYNTNKMGIAGFGAAFDLGVAMKVTDEISLSAAITDLGFIKWTKGSTQKAHSNTSDLNYDSSNPGDIERFANVVGSSKALNLDMVRLVPDNTDIKSRQSMLASTLALGAEYRLVNDKLSLGALFTNRFNKPDNDSELTFSVGVHPSSLLDFAVSCSPGMCGGNSFGLAMKLGPLFVGTDYMFMGKNTKWCNVLVGLSIPLDKRDD